MELKISGNVFALVPNLRVGVLVLSGINNKVDICKMFDSELETITKSMTSKFDGVELAEYPLIRAWRDVYKSFGEKKARSSIEALIRRIVGGKGLYRINPLVDIYNLASLNFELPCGGEDIDIMKNPLELTTANGDEVFLPLGQTETETPNKGEIIYKSGDIVVCRNFNYRESDITKLTENTTNAILVFEDLMGDADKLQHVLDWTSEKVRSLLGAEVKKVAVLDKTSPVL